jgi:hypothetical protein
MTPTVIILLGAAILFYWVVWTGNDPVIELKALLGIKSSSTAAQPTPSAGGANTGPAGGNKQAS